MGIFRSLAGQVRLELTSADVAGTMKRINESGILISEMDLSNDLTVTFTASRRNLRAIEEIAERKGARLCVLERLGVYWLICSLRRRQVLICGMTLLMMLSLFVPSRVLFVAVDGNVQVPDQLILEAAADAGIRFGASRRAVRSERMKNVLLGAVPQLQWAGVNTYGCRAVISVRERETEREPDKHMDVSNLVASCDGVITSCTVTDGRAVCNVGQAVRKGQVLISGYIDCGQFITATRAEGEIFARTMHDLTVITPAQFLTREQLRKRRTNFSLLIGKKRINFVKGSGISDGTCVKMYTEYYITLPGNYRLPLKLLRETILDYSTQMTNATQAQAMDALSRFAMAYLRNQMVALTVLDADEIFSAAAGSYRLTGRYACTEMIGREQGEQIGDFHGKTD